MRISKATAADVSSVAAIYEEIHSAEERGELTVGWIRGVYPTLQTARDALARGDLFIAEQDGVIVGAAIINRVQVDAYALGKWSSDPPENEVMVLHTLAISPACSRRGYGREFVAFYEEYARRNGCTWLRMDTNEKNTRARAMYRKLGYREVGIVPCVFNGIPDVGLVLLERSASARNPAGYPR